MRLPGRGESRPPNQTAPRVVRPCGGRRRQALGTCSSLCAHGPRCRKRGQKRRATSVHRAESHSSSCAVCRRRACPPRARPHRYKRRSGWFCDAALPPGATIGSCWGEYCNPSRCRRCPANAHARPAVVWGRCPQRPTKQCRGAPNRRARRRGRGCASWQCLRRCWPQQQPAPQASSSC